MDWLNWYDLITPTNPFAAIFFGIIITLVVVIVIWIETKETKISILTLLVGWATTFVFVAVLYLFGFY